MWIKTHAGNLINADKLLSIEIAECKTGFQVWGYTANDNNCFILGQYPTKEEAAQAEVEICIKMNHEIVMRMLNINVNIRHDGGIKWKILKKVSTSSTRTETGTKSAR